MKRMEVTEKRIGDNVFYIRPFAAFTAANISGELSSLIASILPAFAPLMGNIGPDAEGAERSIMDAEMEEILPTLSAALSGISGDRIESLMRKLLIDNKNITYEDPDTGKVEIMGADAANEIFCGELQDMYILCWEVIKLNFRGFFKKLGGQFGDLKKVLQTAAPRSKNTEN